MEEYESDSDCSDVDSTADFDSEELVNGKPVMTRSGRQVQARIRFDVWKRFFKTVSHDIRVNRRTVIHTAWMLLQMFQWAHLLHLLRFHKYTFLFYLFCILYVKIPQCRNEDIDQNVPET